MTSAHTLIALNAPRVTVASITVRNLDEDLKRRLRLRAARHGCSMEEEVRQILRAALAAPATSPMGLGSRIAALFDEAGGVELELPPRETVGEPPTFDS